MGRNFYKLTKVFGDVIVMLMVRRHKNVTAEKVEGFRGFFKNILTVQLIFTKLIVRQSSVVVFEIKRLKTDQLLLPW